MKRLLGLILFFIVYTGSAQDFQFDYSLEYTNGDNENFTFYINSKNSSYVLRDGNYHEIITPEYVIYFSVSLQGKTQIYGISPDKFEDNPTKVVLAASDKNEVVVNGFKCRKYTFTTSISDSEDAALKKPITYQAFISDDSLNSVAVLDKNEALFPDSIVYGNFPKGNLVKFESLNNEFFNGYSLLILKKVTKLEKPLVIDITNQQVTKFLINNQVK